MTFIKDISAESHPFPHVIDNGDLCFGCGKPITGAAVAYDGYAEEGRIKSLFFHPLCASEVGQRLIVDGWPNRRKA